MEGAQYVPILGCGSLTIRISTLIYKTTMLYEAQQLSTCVVGFSLQLI